MKPSVFILYKPILNTIFYTMNHHMHPKYKHAYGYGIKTKYIYIIYNSVQDKSTNKQQRWYVGTMCGTGIHEHRGRLLHIKYRIPHVFGTGQDFRITRPFEQPCEQISVTATKPDPDKSGQLSCFIHNIHCIDR